MYFQGGAFQQKKMFMETECLEQKLQLIEYEVFPQQWLAEICRTNIYHIHDHIHDHFQDNHAPKSELFHGAAHITWDWGLTPSTSIHMSNITTVVQVDFPQMHYFLEFRFSDFVRFLGKL
jgi:hypothetical protein